MIRKAKFRLALMVSILVLIFGCNRGQEAIGFDGFDIVFLKMINPRVTDPDKSQLIGEWSVRGTPVVIKITGLLEIGKLEVVYYNPKKIEIEMANWQKMGTLLSVYVELQEAEYTNSSFKLNYIPERDMLVGEYFDGKLGVMYSVEFDRIK